MRLCSFKTSRKQRLAHYFPIFVPNVDKRELRNKESSSNSDFKCVISINRHFKNRGHETHLPPQFIIIHLNAEKRIRNRTPRLISCGCSVKFEFVLL